MNILRTLGVLKAATATGILSSMGLAAVGDARTENVIKTATAENRSLTKAEMDDMKGPHASLYLMAGSLPAFLALHQLEKRKQNQVGAG